MKEWRRGKEGRGRVGKDGGGGEGGGGGLGEDLKCLTAQSYYRSVMSAGLHRPAPVNTDLHLL